MDVATEVFGVKLVDTDGFGGGFATGSSGGALLWNMDSLDAVLSCNTSDSDSAANKKKSTTAEEFLGQNANLVNLNELIVRPPPSSKNCLHIVNIVYSII